MKTVSCGDRIGKWTVVDTRLATSEHGYKVLCVCECGTERPVKLQSLTDGLSMSCGCARRDSVKRKAEEEMIGKRFGMLTVVSFAEIRNKQMLWNCKCDCGGFKIASTHSLRSGNAVSCGCAKGRKPVHGDTVGRRMSRLYTVWNSMRARCNNPKNHAYNDYGGRGITVCSEWDDYVAFKRWAVNNGYDENAPRGKCTIDRIDANGNYCPENCRFVSMADQNRNKRNSAFVEFDGKTKTISEWSKELGISPVTLWERLNVSKWPISRAMTEPVRKRNRKKERADA